MAFIAADRVKETTTTTGTGTVTLGGAVSGFRTFGSVMSDGDTCDYCIVLDTEWEVGTGTLGGSETTLARSVVASSNSNNLVNFSAGAKDVFITFPASAGAKLAGIETGADVTDATNVEAAGALMDSEVDADIKTLSLPASTTITAASATVLDDTTVGDMVNTLGGATSTGTGGLVRATSPTLVTPALGTPASGVATNLTGTASGLTAGTVTTNANLTGDVTSSGNATTIATGAVESEMLNLTIGVRAYRAGAVSYSTEADIVFDTENWDIGGDFNTTTGIFTAPVDGYYDVYCQCRITDLGDGNNALIRLYGNGSIVAFSTVTGASAGGDPTTNVADTIFLTAGQEIKATMNISTSKALSVGSTTSYITINYRGL